MKIKLPSLSRWVADRYLRLQAELKGMVEGNIEIYDEVKEYFDESFIPAYDILMTAFMKPKKSIFTVSVKDADTIRCRAYIGFVKFIRGCLDHYDMSKGKSAYKISILLRKHGNFTNKSFDGKTAHICDLLEKLKNNYNKDIELLGVSEFIEDLRCKNDNFIMITHERFDEKVRKSSVNVTVSRKSMDKACKNICNMIEMLAITSKNPAFEMFIEKFNEILKRYKVRSYGKEDENSGRQEHSVCS